MQCSVTVYEMQLIVKLCNVKRIIVEYVHSQNIKLALTQHWIKGKKWCLHIWRAYMFMVFGEHTVYVYVLPATQLIDIQAVGPHPGSRLRPAKVNVNAHTQFSEVIVKVAT